jgi:hypothetical protein
MATVMALLGCAMDATSAHAEAFGEIAKVGKFGKGPGEFHWPIDLAVDPEESNDVFVVDSPEGVSLIPAFAGASNLRVQKFEATLGAHVMSATIPVPEESMHGLKQYVSNIAVDPSLGRLYVLKRIETGLTEPEPATTVASEIDVYSTKTLALDTSEVPSGVFYTYPKTPFGGSVANGALRDPHGLAVEPGGNHDLLVLGVNEDGNTVIQRISATGPSLGTGQPDEEFIDIGEQLEPNDHSVEGIAAGPGGVIYLGGKDIKGAGQEPGVVKLSTESAGHSLADPEISLLYGAVNGETPPLFGGSTYSSNTSGNVGEQLAVSPDSGVVYESAVTRPEISEEHPGSYELRGISTVNGAPQIVYGGVEPPSQECHIESQNFAIAAGSGGVVYALDEGWDSSASSEEPYPYGFHLIEFGPGGKGCPAPATSLAVTVNGHAESGPTVSVGKGVEVMFEASSGELKGAQPTELKWEITGPESRTTTITAGCPSSCLGFSHRFLTPGSYTVTLSMAVNGSGFGPPPPVTRKIEVTAPAPTASFEVFDLSSNPVEPKPGEEVTFNAEGSLDPAGKCSEANGCEGTPELESYTWNFGDGSPEVTTKERTITHSFVNASSQSLQDTVTLTVANKEQVHSTPTTQTLTIQGTPEGKLPPVVVTPITTPITTPVSKTPVTVVKPPTTAQKLALALKACRKDKAGKRRARCEKQAKRKYSSKPRKKHKKQ